MACINSFAVMKPKKRINVFFIVGFMGLFFMACNSKPKFKKATKPVIDSIFGYLGKGDSVYALKNHIDNFAVSIRYYDTAAQIANQYDNDSAKRFANHSIGNAYDAWNLMPEKTVYYYNLALQNARDLNDSTVIAYTDLLLAHAYMKAGDSAKAIEACERCSNDEIPKAVAIVHDRYNNELAYIAALVKNYPYSLKYSTKVKHPELIKNSNLNYKSHQTITQLMLHLHYLHTDMPAWIDSAKNMLSHSSNLSDSVYYSYVLQGAYSYLSQLDSSTRFYKINQELINRFGNKLDQSNAKSSFLEYEVKESEKQKALSDLEKSNLTKTIIIVSLVVLLLLVGIVFILFNRKKIAGKNKALAKLNQQLNDKATQNELLVKEMHHRVKNNLTLIYSLLEMQGRKSDNEEIQEQLLAARQRIESIAITHEQLYSSQDGEINMYAYISNLVQHIINGHTANSGITTDIHIEENIVLNTNTCLPLAMLINEWLTNTMKYADTDNNEIVAHINAYQIDKTITLIYFDTGAIAENDNVKAGLGSKIINLLCKQIKATLNTTYNNKPYHYKISFTV